MDVYRVFCDKAPESATASMADNIDFTGVFCVASYVVYLTILVMHLYRMFDDLGPNKNCR